MKKTNGRYKVRAKKGKKKKKEGEREKELKDYPRRVSNPKTQKELGRRNRKREKERQLKRERRMKYALLNFLTSRRRVRQIRYE